jgi:hypothetical protein
VSSLNTGLTLKPPLAAEEWRAGWRIVLASLCGIAFGVTGLFFYSAGIFLKPVAGEFGWSRAAASTVPLAAALALGFAAPSVGNIVDRCESRSPVVVSSIGLALGFWLLSYAPPSLAIYLALVWSIASLHRGWLAAHSRWLRADVGSLPKEASAGRRRPLPWSVLPWEPRST